MNETSQYGEEEILKDFFKGQTRGTVVDVGAADGKTFSNSYWLIEEMGWRGLLIEPETDQFVQLQKQHTRNNVTRLHCAVAKESKDAWLYIAGNGSTLSEDWRDRGLVKFTDVERVLCHPLKNLLAWVNCPDTIDFLTIDCEGMDLEVLQSMDFKRYDVKLICVESGDDGTADDPLNHYLKSVGFVYHARTRGNTFWRKP